jgi:hypothetical protein
VCVQQQPARVVLGSEEIAGKLARSKLRSINIEDVSVLTRVPTRVHLRPVVVSCETCSRTRAIHNYKHISPAICGSAFAPSGGTVVRWYVAARKRSTHTLSHTHTHTLTYTHTYTHTHTKSTATCGSASKPSGKLGGRHGANRSSMVPASGGEGRRPEGGGGPHVRFLSPGVVYGVV